MKQSAPEKARNSSLNRTLPALREATMARSLSHRPMCRTPARSSSAHLRESCSSFLAGSLPAHDLRLEDLA